MGCNPLFPSFVLYSPPNNHHNRASPLFFTKITIVKTKTTIGIFVTITLLMVAPSIAKNLTGFEESLTNHGNFIIAHG
jgi:hypothetical protein